MSGFAGPDRWQHAPGRAPTMRKRYGRKGTALYAARLRWADRRWHLRRLRPAAGRPEPADREHRNRNGRRRRGGDRDPFLRKPARDPRYAGLADDAFAARWRIDFTAADAERRSADAD